jgi:hypothetical protein
MALVAAAGRWLFAPGDARTAAAVRIGVCALYLFMLWDLQPAMDLLFGRGGLFGTREPLPYDISGFQYFLFRHDSPAELSAWFWASVAAAACALVGFASRVSVAATFVSMLLFQERDPFMIFGADLVLRCVALWLLFLDSGRAWSVDAWLRGPRPAAGVVQWWPLRAMQLQVALVYAVTCLLKVRTEPWRDGSAVYYALHVGAVLKSEAPPWPVAYPALLVAMDYATLATEASLPVLLFFRRVRPVAFALAVAMHTGIDAFMSIRFFSLAMYAGLLSFLDGSDWDRITAALRRVRAATWAWAPRPGRAPAARPPRHA